MLGSHSYLLLYTLCRICLVLPCFGGMASCLQVRLTLACSTRTVTVRKSMPGRSHQGDGRTEESQAQPNTPMNPSDLLAETVFGKATALKNIIRLDPILGSKISPPKWGPLKKKWIRGPRFWGPKFGPQNGVRPT